MKKSIKALVGKCLGDTVLEMIQITDEEPNWRKEVGIETYKTKLLILKS